MKKKKSHLNKFFHSILNKKKVWSREFCYTFSKNYSNYDPEKYYFFLLVLWGCECWERPARRWIFLLQKRFFEILRLFFSSSFPLLLIFLCAFINIYFISYKTIFTAKILLVEYFMFVSVFRKRVAIVFSKSFLNGIFITFHCDDVALFLSSCSFSQIVLLKQIAFDHQRWWSTTTEHQNCM